MYDTYFVTKTRSKKVKQAKISFTHTRGKIFFGFTEQLKRVQFQRNTVECDDIGVEIQIHKYIPISCFTPLISKNNFEKYNEDIQRQSIASHRIIYSTCARHIPRAGMLRRAGVYPLPPFTLLHYYHHSHSRFIYLDLFIRVSGLLGLHHPEP